MGILGPLRAMLGDLDGYYSIMFVKMQLLYTWESCLMFENGGVQQQHSASLLLCDL